jgi:hypothetical protein
MARMMGFSSFGDRPQKKRKYNPHADAITDTSPSNGGGGGRRGPEPHTSTGSNSMPLGTRAPRPTGNADEIDLDGDSEGEPQGHLSSSGFNASGGSANQAADASQQASSDALHMHGFPQRPAAGFSQSPSRQNHGGHWQQRGPPGDPGAPWYEGYYDSLSNRNPWEKLENTMGLQPKGTWISHEQHASSIA